MSTSWAGFWVTATIVFLLTSIFFFYKFDEINTSMDIVRSEKMHQKDSLMQNISDLQNLNSTLSFQINSLQSQLHSTQYQDATVIENDENGQPNNYYQSNVFTGTQASQYITLKIKQHTNFIGTYYLDVLLYSYNTNKIFKNAVINVAYYFDRNTAPFANIKYTYNGYILPNNVYKIKIPKDDNRKNAKYFEASIVSVQPTS